MANATVDLDAVGRLSERLDEFSSRSVADRLLLVRQVAEQVQALHEGGRIHGDIRPDTLVLDERMLPRLSDPPAQRHFGGADSDPEVCPPDLVGRAPLALPNDAAVAARLLENDRRAIHPQRIDLYQLGVLLCRLLTGRSMREYMTSPTVKGRVPSAAQRCLARAIGFDAEEPYEDCGGFIAGLDEAMRSAPSAPSAQVGDAGADTWPPVAGRGESQDTSRAPYAAISPRSADAEGLPFRKLGKFEIIERIGSGGMGDVYKGYDASLQRLVAVKVLPPELARDRKLMERFQSEAAAVARLNHPNLVSVYSIGEEEGRHYFAMPYIEGESLARALERQSRPATERSLEIVEQCLAGLEAAHAEGLIHRDIKPGNILIERETGRVVLIDFGLVRRADSGARLTAPGMVMGTVDYMAPEQAQGQHVDARADLYAVGVLMYRLLAGRLPFAAETPTAVIYQHVHEDPRALLDVVPDVPASLARIVKRLIEKDPARRYQSAADVLDELRAFRRDEIGPSSEPDDKPAPVSPRAGYRGGRRRAWIAGSLVAAVLAGFVVSWQLLLAEGGPEKGNAAAAELGPGKELPPAEWVDVLQPVDPTWDIVSGDWRRSKGELFVAPEKYCRLMLPVELEGSYDLRGEFTRLDGGAVLFVLPVGGRHCMMAFDNWSVHALEMIDGMLTGDRLNPAARRPGRLINGQRYMATVSVRLKGDDVTIDVTLDDQKVISWTGKQKSLEVLQRWGLPRAHRPALGADLATVTWHGAAVRAVSDKASMVTRPKPPEVDLAKPEWRDLLTDINLDRDTIHGRWLKAGQGVAVAPAAENERFVRLMLPANVEGSYDLATEFTRTAGADSVTVTLPVGTRQCTVHLSALLGRFGGIERIGERNILDQLNPAVRRPAGLVNGQRYQLLARVRLAEEDAAIEVWLDGRPFVYWAGKQSSLSLDNSWVLPQRRRVGIGANVSGVTFHSVHVRPIEPGAMAYARVNVERH